MAPIDVDEIVDVNFTETSGEDEAVEVLFKDGTTKRFSGEDFPQALAVLNHWTPPTA